MARIDASWGTSRLRGDGGHVNLWHERYVLRMTSDGEHGCAARVFEGVDGGKRVVKWRTEDLFTATPGRYTPASRRSATNWQKAPTTSEAKILASRQCGRRLRAKRDREF